MGHQNHRDQEQNLLLELAAGKAIIREMRRMRPADPQTGCGLLLGVVPSLAWRTPPAEGPCLHPGSKWDGLGVSMRSELRQQVMKIWGLVSKHTLSPVNTSFLWTSRKSAYWFRGRWGRTCNDVSHFPSSGEIVLIFPSFQHHGLAGSMPSDFSSNPLPTTTLQGTGSQSHLSL